MGCCGLLLAGGALAAAGFCWPARGAGGQCAGLRSRRGWPVAGPQQAQSWPAAGPQRAGSVA
eukprot:2391872-Lingulodinium_polyedra.AAC.1